MTQESGRLDIPFSPEAEFIFAENTSGCTVAKYTGPGGVVRIPAQHAGRRVTAIADGAFCECTGVTGIVLPDGVETIGEFAFQNCTLLTAVTFPAALRTIGQYAFNACGLTEAALPDGLETIGEAAFRDCAALRSWRASPSRRGCTRLATGRSASV